MTVPLASLGGGRQGTVPSTAQATGSIRPAAAAHTGHPSTCLQPTDAVKRKGGQKLLQTNAPSAGQAAVYPLDFNLTLSRID